MILAQLKDGYRYNSDTLFLYDFICELRPKGRVLDVGCGCGILGLLLKRDFNKISLYGIDKQPINVKISAFNAEKNGLEAEFFEGDFTEFKSDDRYDFIVSNPPFYHDGVKQSENLHINISRYEQHLELEKFLRVANSHLSPAGVVAFCYEAGRIDDIFCLLKTLKLNATEIKFIHPKESKEAKLVLLCARKNSCSLCKILPTIFVKDGEKDSAKAREIYTRAATQSTEWSA